MSRSGLFSTESDLDTSPPAAAAPSPDLSNTPPLPAFSLSDKEKDNQLSILLRLLQRASRSPEEMIEGALELSLVGLLSRGVLEGLCKSVGLGDAQSASVLGLQSQHALALTQMQRVAAGAPAPAPMAPVSIRTLLEAPIDLPQLGGGASSSTALSLRGAPAALPSTCGPSSGPGGSPWDSLLSPTAASSFGLGSFAVASRFTSEFTLLERLGQGGGGAVFRARNILDGTEYAIKRVFFWSRPGSSAQSEVAAQRVLREVRALARLNHPNVCRYHSAWIETDWPSFFDNVVAGATSVSAAGRQQPGTPLKRTGSLKLLKASGAATDLPLSESGASGTSGPELTNPNLTNSYLTNPNQSLGSMEDLVLARQDALLGLGPLNTERIGLSPRAPPRPARACASPAWRPTGARTSAAAAPRRPRRACPRARGRPLPARRPSTRAPLAPLATARTTTRPELSRASR